MRHRHLRIVFLDSWLTASAEGSGTAVGVRGLATGLSRLGHDVQVVRPRAAGRAISTRLRFNLDLDPRLEETQSPDLVVGIDIDGFFWSRARRRPSGGTDDAGRPPYVVCLKGIAADEARFEQGPARIDLETLARFERLNVERADRVIVPSRYSAEVATRAYGVPEGRIGVVPEALDLSRWHLLNGRAHADVAPGHATILSVARQYPRKDTETLLRAMAVLLPTFPAARLRIVGNGPTLPHSQALARSLDIEHAVEFLGALGSDDDVANEYRRADVFCLPSRQEGFGIAFVEAMAAGIPIVAVRAGAVPEVVPSGEVGLLVQPEDPPALAAALQTLLRDPALRYRMGEAGRDRAARYGLEPVAKAFIEDMERVIA